MNIRPATPGDAAAVAAIWNPVIRDTTVTFNAVEKTKADLAALIAGRACFLVAEEAGDLLGFASYTQFRGGVGYAHTMEHSVILSPAARGRGLGRGLLTAIEDHARAAGAHSMIGGVSSGNPAAIGFHAAMGYTEVAVLPEVGRKFGRWFDLHLMQKRL